MSQLGYLPSTLYVAAVTPESVALHRVPGVRITGLNSILIIPAIVIIHVVFYPILSAGSLEGNITNHLPS